MNNNYLYRRFDRKKDHVPQNALSRFCKDIKQNEYGSERNMFFHRCYRYFGDSFYRSQKFLAGLSQNQKTVDNMKNCSKIRVKTTFNVQSNFIEIALWHGCSPVNLLHIFTTPFPKNTSGRLLLNDEIHSAKCNLPLREKCPNTPYLSLFSPNAGKYGPENTPYWDTFHAVYDEKFNAVFQDIILYNTI